MRPATVAGRAETRRQSGGRGCRVGGTLARPTGTVTVLSGSSVFAYGRLSHVVCFRAALDSPAGGLGPTRAWRGRCGARPAPHQ
jgi:hypothetical protein